MREFNIEGHEPSLLPDGNWKMVWSDEFDGIELDRTKWDYRLSMMGNEWPSWTDKGVTLDGKGNAVFSIVEENGRPVCSQLQTGYNVMDEPIIKKTVFGDNLQWQIGKLKQNLFTHTYGYYECRCRLQQNPKAWWSAFWLQSPIIGTTIDPAESGTELDIMECFDPGEVVYNAHTGGYGVDLRSIKIGKTSGLSLEEFHRFGLLWDENGYTIYINGEEKGHISENISRRPQFIMLSTEVVGYRKTERKAVQQAYDLIGKDVFTVDYVRVFDRMP